MTNKKRQRAILGWGLGVVAPIALSLLFYALRSNLAIMDWWVDGILVSVAQMLGRFWGLIPLSVAELMVVSALVLVPLVLIRGIYLTVRRGTIKPLVGAISPLVITGLWLFAALNWMWNVTYYSTGFTEKSGLDTSPYSVEELIATTEYFAQRAAELSTQQVRTDSGHFTMDQSDCFLRATTIYDNLEEEFPFLEMEDVQAKAILFSNTQSRLGFTGMYFPFTGEANVNVDIPQCLQPAVIAHEMSHQRMVASEDEANFLGIAACVTSDDIMFQYSGYLFGLMQLSNALNSVDATSWQEIWTEYATYELYTDWNDNYTYWEQLESPVEETATQMYDDFLKGNDQELGMQSYGACVDLLVAYFNP